MVHVCKAVLRLLTQDHLLKFIRATHRLHHSLMVIHLMELMARQITCLSASKTKKLILRTRSIRAGFFMPCNGGAELNVRRACESSLTLISHYYVQ